MLSIFQLVKLPAAAGINLCVQYTIIYLLLLWQSSKKDTIPFPILSALCLNVSMLLIKARRKRLQMPPVAVRVGDPCKGTSFTILLEHYHGINYLKSLVINGLVSACATQNLKGLEKDCVKMLLGLAQSDPECGYIRYAIFKACGISATWARHQDGFERMTEHSQLVEEAIAEAQPIGEAVDDIANIHVQDSTLLANFGIEQGTCTHVPPYHAMHPLQQ